MAKKRGIKKKSKKKVVRTKPKRVSKKLKPKKRVVKRRATGKKMSIVIKNLILFVVLAIISYLLYNVSGSELLRQLFYLAAILMGFIALAFLIVLLVLLFLRLLKK